MTAAAVLWGGPGLKLKGGLPRVPRMLITGYSNALIYIQGGLGVCS